MSVTLTGPSVAKKKVKPSGRIELRAELEWIARVERQAERFGVGLSGYIRLAVAERLERDEATDPSVKPSGRGKR
jgi:hypothetical protein